MSRPFTRRERLVSATYWLRNNYNAVKVMSDIRTITTAIVSTVSYIYSLFESYLLMPDTQSLVQLLAILFERIEYNL